MSRFVFGPVPSRRLGRSLGIDLTPAKTCTLDCRYCQLIPTSHPMVERKNFCSPDEVLAELRHTLAEISPPDWITISGTGEPTLHAGLGRIIKEIRELNVAPVCVITNSTLLNRPDVRTDLEMADRLMPTLCTVDQKTFELIHRPFSGVSLDDILKGLRKLSSTYKGILDLEIFVCKGINDTKSEIEGLKRYLETLKKIDSIYLNTAVRPAHDPTIVAATSEDLLAFKQALGARWPVTTVFEHSALPKRVERTPPPPRQGILDMLLRHPCTKEQLMLMLNLTAETVNAELQKLSEEGRVMLCSDGLWRIL